MHIMNWLRRLMILAGFFLLAGRLSSVAGETPEPKAAATNAPAVAPTNALPAVDPAKAEEELKVKARKYQGLAKRLPPLFKEKNYDQARHILEKMIELLPEEPNAWYNLSCVQARQNATNEAMHSLTVSVDNGFADFTLLERDEDLAVLRHLPEYRKLVRRRDEIQQKRATTIHDQLVKEFGKDYLFGIDHHLRLVYATDIDQRTLHEMKSLLSRHANALQNDLFDHGFDQYLTVVIPKEWKQSAIGGYYQQENHFLTAENIGATLTHEFTHALHFADQNARGQEHAYWTIEGLASLFESSEISWWGHAVPQSNHRLTDLQSLIKQKKTVPWDKFVKLSPGEFMRGVGHSYSQARYMLFYLYAHGKLRDWYDAYVEGFEEDATGAKALEKVFGKELAAIEKDWTDWVMKLPAPRMKLDPGNASLGIMTKPEKDGICIEQLLPGAAAEQAGLKAGDVITRIDGERIIEPEQLLKQIGSHAVGDRVRVEYRRGSEYDRVRVTLTPLPKPEEARAQIKAQAEAAKKAEEAKAAPVTPPARPEDEKKEKAG